VSDSCVQIHDWGVFRPGQFQHLLHAQGDRFIEKNRTWLSYQQLSVLRALKNCRTAALGSHVDRCSNCGHQAISYNSCRNRHCPKCQAQARQRWLDARQQELLGVPYFHVVFTLPQELNPLCQRHPALLYNLLFQASAETMIEVAADPKHLGAHIWFLSILKLKQFSQNCSWPYLKVSTSPIAKRLNSLQQNARDLAALVARGRPFKSPRPASPVCKQI
jgi:hypothetical protein